MRKLAATIVKRMGVEALELLQSSKVDLVLTDWIMSSASTFPRSCACKAHKLFSLQGRWHGGAGKAGPVGGYLTKVEFSSSEINR